jgi:hypothetical protein
VKLQAYAYEQFYEITTRLLTSNQYNVDEEIDKVLSKPVRKTSKNIRDTIKIAKITKSIEDVNWIVMNFLEAYQPKISADLAAASSNASLGSLTP